MSQDPTLPTVSPTGPPRTSSKPPALSEDTCVSLECCRYCPKSEILLLQDLRQKRVTQLALLKHATPMLVHPPLKKLQTVASYTLRPPKEGSHSAAPRNIGVILRGQFYVYNVDTELMDKVNTSTFSDFKAGALMSHDYRIVSSSCCQVNKLGGVTISWGKSPFVAPRPRIRILHYS